MLTLPSVQRMALAQRVLLAFLILNLFIASGCSGAFGIRRKVEVPRLLSPLTDANTDQLMSEVNQLATVKSIHGKVDIQFQDTSFADAGVSDKYRTVAGAVTLQRPGRIYLIIQVPVVAVDVAQMTSDGQKFRVAVLQGDEKYKRFVKGTNDAEYEKLQEDGAKRDSATKPKPRGEKATVNALSNLRPQHLTDALMIRPITPAAESGLVYARSEFYQEEVDTRPGAKKSSRVVRGYYLLEEFSQPSAGEAHLTRRFWFDRVGSIRLARLQTFTELGALITDVAYSDERAFGTDGHVRLPSRVELTRPQDRYKLSLTYQAPESVSLDHEYSPEAFVLENKWQLPEFDLDAPQNKRPKTPQ